MVTFNRILCLFIIAVIIGFTTPADATQRLKYTGIARSTGGAVLGSATVTIYLAGTTTPANVYEASTGGDSVTSVTTDSNGRWTFYADVADYAFTQEYKVVVTKDGYSTITLDNIFNLSLPTDAVGVLTNDGSGNYTWSAASFSESGDYSPTGTWDWSGATVSGLDYLPLAGGTVTGSTSITKVNAAGGSADALTLSGTLGIMDGADDIFRGIYLNYTNSNHTAGNVFAINIAGITGDADATESAIYIQEGWDSGILSYSPVHLKGPSDVGKLFLFDTGEADYIAIVPPADVTTSWTMVLPASEPTGLLRADAGTVSTTDTLSTVTISGFDASKVMATDGSGNATTLAAQNVITTGYVDGLVNAVISTSSPVTVAGQARYYINGSDSVKTFNLPAAGLGKMYCFANALYANALTIHPATDDIIILAGENDDTSDVVSTGAATDKICVLGLDTTYWYVTSSTGEWAND